MTDYMTFTNTFNVDSIERLNNSTNGNPRFLFTFDNGFRMATPVDAGWVYAIVPSAIVNTTIRVKYRTPRRQPCIPEWVYERRSFDYEILGIA